DAYDAMSSRRSYRDVLPQQTVREEIIKGRGTQFDPDFADKVEISGANEGVDMKGETYYWANLGDTVTLVSADPEYSISEAWRDTDESKALTCDAGSCSFEVPIEGAIWLNGKLEKVSPTETPTETPEPTSTPEPPGCPCVWCCGTLPRTGFSSGRSTVLPVQPKDVDYKPTRMLLQIPVLNIRTELVTVPLKDGIWQVEWLKDRAGVLEGSALPGKGISIVAAHNTLDHTEYGPFAMLREAEINDLITVKTANGSVSSFRVYANVLLEPDDMQKLVKIAGQEENSLVLVTCENESVEGGYLNRRVVFAKPN
ncbi:MAG: sortase, partial [Anaerolineaceae bacterium]|nr:sortase [Anaerolineaceae bacterium]